MFKEYSDKKLADLLREKMEHINTILETLSERDIGVCVIVDKVSGYTKVKTQIFVTKISREKTIVEEF